MGRVIIIAEAGVNHNGDIKLAYELIDAAVEAGVDYVKFQTFVTEEIVDKSAEKADYQKASTGANESQFDMIKKLELSFDDFHELKNYCVKKNIKFLTTVADFVSLDRLDEYGVDFIKISSGELTNTLFLKKVAAKKKPVILSTGMAYLSEVESALLTLEKEGIERENVIVLHCNTEYPTPMKDVNLRAMTTIAQAFKIKVGYSDHTLGIEIPVAAVALGACVIEKHFTINKELPGPDHSASLTPRELKEMVIAIRNVEAALSGTGCKQPSVSESKNIPIVRKSIFIATEIREGEILSETNISLKRPGDGIPARDIEKVLGKKAKQNLKPGIKLTYQDIQW